MDFPGGSVVKNLPANAGDVGSVPGLGRSPGEGHGNPFHYSCLENPMGRWVWQSTVHGVTRVRHNPVTMQPPPMLKVEILPRAKKLMYSFAIDSEIINESFNDYTNTCICIYLSLWILIQ